MENDDEREELTAEERADIEADLDDLGAMRTIFGRARVTHTVCPRASRAGNLCAGTSKCSSARQAGWPLVSGSSGL